MRLQPQQPSVHGGAGAGIDLSASLNPLGPSPRALEAARSARLDRYPEPDARSLRLAAAARHGVAADAVVPVPGAGFGLWLLAVALLKPGDRCVALGPCFGEYARSAAIAGAAYQEVRATEPNFAWDLDVLMTELCSGAAMCIVGNPGNPTGRAIAASDLRELCSTQPATVFVVDEAFAAFGPGAISLLEGKLPPNAVVVRSLTKELGLPGLRMGYLIAEPTIASRLAGVMPPWPLSSTSIAAAVAGMEDLPHIERGASLARVHIDRIAEGLRARDLNPVPTDANYLLVWAPTLTKALARRDITVRNCASFGLPVYVRIAAPTPADLPRVLDAIAEIE